MPFDSLPLLEQIALLRKDLLQPLKSRTREALLRKKIMSLNIAAGNKKLTQWRDRITDTTHGHWCEAPMTELFLDLIEAYQSAQPQS